MVNGGVPQGTICGPELFKHMVSDFHTVVSDFKFVDDSTLVEVCKRGVPSHMQEAADEAQDWSMTNKLAINCIKTKELLIHTGKDSANISPVTIDGKEIDRVPESKLLGVIIQDNLKWDKHVEHITKKASKRLYYIRELKRAGVPPAQLLLVFKSLVRSVLEYACQVWFTSITKEQKRVLEMTQKRACKIIVPGLSYNDAITHLDIPTIENRLESLCQNFFKDMTDPQHKMNHLLPPVKKYTKEIRNQTTYPLPICKTNRYKNSFVPYCLFRFQ